MGPDTERRVLVTSPASATLRGVVPTHDLTEAMPLPATSAYRSPRSHVVGTLAMVGMLVGNSGAPLPSFRFPAPRPRGYRVHLTKAERKGLTPEQMQAMREARLP